MVSASLDDLHDIGYGTAYERSLLNNLLKGIIKTYNIRSILEYPANDLLGDYELLYRGIDLPVKRSRSITLERYDLVWNFCEIERNDPNKLLTEMIKSTKSYILLVGQNIFNLGVPLHKFYHLLLNLVWDHGDPKHMRLSYAKYLFRNNRLQILEHGYFDAPIFILDLYESGSVVMKKKSSPLRSKNGLLSKILLKKSPFEKAPHFLKFLLCHHWYLLGRVSI